MRCRRQLCLAAIGSIALVPLDPSIVRRHDRADSLYVALGAAYPAVGRIGRMGDGTLIGDRWVLTAAHVAAGALQRGAGALSVTLGGRERRVSEVFVHPAWREMGPHDIALLRLREPVRGVAPVGLNRAGTERGTVAVLVGHGGTGNGDGQKRAEDGKRRAATSRVDSASSDWLFFSFDAPERATRLEGAPGPGDSGGPALVGEGRGARVAGVSSAGHDGRTGPGSYGAVDVFTRVSTHAQWLDSVVAGIGTARAAARRDAPGSAPAVPPARADTGFPRTPTGARGAAFVAAMRDGSDRAILAFLNGNFAAAELAGRPAEARLANFRRLAGLVGSARLEQVDAPEPTRIRLRFAGAEGSVILELLTEPAAPHAIIDWRRVD